MTTRLECGVCRVTISAGTTCRPDSDRALGIFGELDWWAQELVATASGIRGQRPVERRATRVHAAGVVDENRLELAEWVIEARAAWQDTATRDGCDDLATSGAYFVGGWGRGPAFVAAMLGVESRVLGLLDPDECVLREQRARVARHAAGGRPRGVPDAGALLRRATSARVS